MNKYYFNSGGSNSCSSILPRDPRKVTRQLSNSGCRITSITFNITATATTSPVPNLSWLKLFLCLKQLLQHPNLCQIKMWEFLIVAQYTHGLSSVPTRKCVRKEIRVYQLNQRHPNQHPNSNNSQGSGRTQEIIQLQCLSSHPSTLQ